MDHREARRCLNQDRQLFSPPVQRFIGTFGELQDARHAEDYDPSRVITPSEATHWIDRAHRGGDSSPHQEAESVEA